MVFSVDNLLQIVITFQGVFMTFFWVTSKPLEKSYYGLVLILGLLALQMFSLFLVSLGIFQEFLSRWNIAYGFVYSVVFYQYTKLTLYEDYRIASKELLQSIPFVIAALLAISSITIHYPFVYAAYLISALVYFWLANRAIYHYTSVVKSTRSSLHSQKLFWLKCLFGIYLLVIATDTIQFTLSYFYAGHEVTSLVQTLTYAIVLLLTCAITYFSLLYSNLYIAALKEEIAAAYEDPVQGISNSDKTQFESLGSSLESLMNQKKLYLNPDMGLIDVASELTIPARQLSRVIKEVFKTNFSDYINSYRVEEAVRMLTNPTDSKETISEVMYKCGFSTKSAFFTCFKKKKGISPKEFKMKFSKS